MMTHSLGGAGEPGSLDVIRQLLLALLLLCALLLAGAISPDTLSQAVAALIIAWAGGAGGSRLRLA
jgi:hypothetical protein